MSGPLMSALAQVEWLDMVPPVVGPTRIRAPITAATVAAQVVALDGLPGQSS